MTFASGISFVWSHPIILNLVWSLFGQRIRWMIMHNVAYKILQQHIQTVLKTGIRNENWLKHGYKHKSQQKFLDKLTLFWEGQKGERFFNCRNTDKWHIQIWFYRTRINILMLRLLETVRWLHQHILNWKGLLKSRRKAWAKNEEAIKVTQALPASIRSPDRGSFS